MILQHVMDKPHVHEPLYQQLIYQVNLLSNPVKQALISLYKQFSEGIFPKEHLYHHVLANDASHAIANIKAEAGYITTCFGCQCVTQQNQATEHSIVWQTGKVFAWCIWDAFFIVQQLGKSAKIYSQDPINKEKIEIEFDGKNFLSPTLWFSFPLGQAELGDSIRSCFCCRTKAFTCRDTAIQFAKAQQCEIIDNQQIIIRTQQMVNALTPQKAA